MQVAVAAGISVKPAMLALRPIPKLLADRVRLRSSTWEAVRQSGFFSVVIKAGGSESEK